MFEWDEQKRLWTIKERGLDFIDAAAAFDGRSALHFRAKDGGEERFVTIAVIENKCFTVIWTWRGDARRIVSFRRSQDGEEKKYRARYR